MADPATKVGGGIRLIVLAFAVSEIAVWLLTSPPSLGASGVAAISLRTLADFRNSPTRPLGHRLQPLGCLDDCCDCYLLERKLPGRLCAVEPSGLSGRAEVFRVTPAIIRAMPISSALETS